MYDIHSKCIDIHLTDYHIVQMIIVRIHYMSYFDLFDYMPVSRGVVECKSESESYKSESESYKSESESYKSESESYKSESESK